MNLQCINYIIPVPSLNYDPASENKFVLVVNSRSDFFLDEGKKSCPGCRYMNGYCANSCAP